MDKISEIVCFLIILEFRRPVDGKDSLQSFLRRLAIGSPSRQGHVVSAPGGRQRPFTAHLRGRAWGGGRFDASTEHPNPYSHPFTQSPGSLVL